MSPDDEDTAPARQDRVVLPDLAKPERRDLPPRRLPRRGPEPGPTAPPLAPEGDPLSEADDVEGVASQRRPAAARDQ